MVVIGVLEPHAPRPQLGLQGMHDACHRVRLPQQAHLTKQVLINGTACHQRQHLASHTEGLHHINTKPLLWIAMSAYVLDAYTANMHIKHACCLVKVEMDERCAGWCDAMGGSVQQAKQSALERQDLSRTYLAHHDPESVTIIIGAASKAGEQGV